ncbi:hypothetical protein RDWZM_000629 [Blomia tropicalis]|uniref:BAR domain-containing protein n=1 Tax=Blomia tropicalis TaxID=40697 RepID=A0A9Q0RPS3_BLOTA|nr:hypothetical protein RDWZM_000629 [Blomia tropicalis]
MTRFSVIRPNIGRGNVLRMFSKTQVSPNGPNQSDSLDNKDLDSNAALLREYDDRRNKLCKEFKKLTDCLNDLNYSEYVDDNIISFFLYNNFMNNRKQLLQDLNSMTTHSIERLNLIVDKWSTFSNQIAKNREDLATIINRTSIEPLKKFQNGFNEMRSAIKRYEQLTADFNKYTQKVAKYKDSERTSTVIIKLNDYQSRLAQAQSDLNTLRAVLERELPMFLLKRSDYFQPSLVAFISSEILFSGNNLNALKELQPIGDEVSEVERQERQNKLFDSIDSLSIVNS